MAEQNHGARRRKAFAEFKENQYDDAFSLSASQKKKKTAGRIVRWVLIVVLTIAFILIGFVVTDALLDISQQPYHDPNTYTPKFVNTTTTVTTTTTTTSATQETDEDEENASYDEDEETDAEDTENTEDTDDTENTEETEDAETDEDNADSENTDDTEEAD